MRMKWILFFLMFTASVFGQTIGFNPFTKMISPGDLNARFKSLVSSNSLGNFPKVVNVKSPPFSAWGNGTTDDTVTLTSALNSADGLVVYFPDGTYLIDTITITKRIALVLSPGAKLLHKANASDALLRFTVPPYEITGGGTIDGNNVNQDNSHRRDLILINSGTTTFYTCRIAGVNFVNYAKQSIHVVATVGKFDVEGCLILNGKEHGGTLGMVSAGITYENNDSGMVNTVSELNVINTIIRQDAAPSVLTSTDSTAPGGIIVVAGNSILPTVNTIWIDVRIKECTFQKIGQNRALNSIAVNHFYQGVRDAIITDNRYIDCYYVKTSLQNAGQLTVKNNKFYTTPGFTSPNTATVIWVNPNQRADNARAVNYSDISGNLINGYSGDRAMWFLGSNASGYELKFNENTITNVREGIFIENWEGPATVGFNHVSVKNGTGSSFNSISGVNNLTLDLVGNYLISSNVTGSIFTGVNQVLNARGNWFEADGSGWTAMVAQGLKGGYFTDNRFNGLNSAAAVSIGQDASANHMAALSWSDDNVVLAGSKTINFGQVDKLVGRYTHNTSPQGGIAAPVGTHVVDGSNGDVWTKETGTGYGGWRKGPKDVVPAADSVNAFRVVKNDGFTSVWRVDTLNSKVITGPANVDLGYRFNIEEDVAGVALLIGARNGTAGGAALFEVMSDSAAGALGSWSSTYASAYLQDKFGLIAETTASAVMLAAPNPGQTLDFYAGSSTLGAQLTSAGLRANVQNVINVTMPPYNAVADGGTTDNTTAINAAATAGGDNSVIYFPKGASYYKITGPILYRSGQVFVGQASGPQDNTGQVEIRQATASTSIFKPNNLAIDTVNVRISDLKLTGSTSSTVVHFYRTSYSQVDRVNISGGAVGVEINANVANQAYFNSFYDTRLGYQTSYGITFTNGANANNFYNGWIGGTPTSVVMRATSVGNTFWGTSFQGVGGANPTATHVYNGGGENKLMSCWIEQATGPAIWDENATTITITPTWGSGITTYHDWTSSAHQTFRMETRPGGASSFLQAGKFIINPTFNTSLVNLFFSIDHPEYASSGYQYLWGYGNTPVGTVALFQWYNGTVPQAQINMVNGSLNLNMNLSGGKLSIYDQWLSRLATGFRIEDNAGNDRDLQLRTLNATAGVTLPGGDVQTQITANRSATQTATHTTPSTTTPLSPTWTGADHTVWYGVTGTINLPAAATYTGRTIRVYNTGAFTITIDPNASEVVVRDGAVQTGGVNFTLASGAGNYVVLISDGVRWITLDHIGTLTVGT